MLDSVLVIQSYVVFKKRQYFEESCPLNFLPAQSKCLHQVYVFSKVVLQIFFAEKFLGDGLVDIILENLEVLRCAVSHMVNKFTELLEIESSDIILILSH